MARYEKFSQPPHAAHVGRGQRKPSVLDRHLAMLANEREMEKLRISSENELARELLDYTIEQSVDEYGFPHSTRYQIPDSVPDVYVPASKEKDAPQEQKKDVTPGSSSDE